MSSESLLLLVGLAFAGIALLTLVTWLGFAVFNVIQARRLAVRKPLAMSAVAGALRTGNSTRAINALRELTTSGSIAVLVEMAQAVSGAQRLRLNQLARDFGIMAKAGSWSASQRWSQRLRAARLLAYFGSDADADVGWKLLCDPDPDVRAEAALWAGRQGPDYADQLTQMLEDPASRARFNAGEALRKTNGAGAAALERRLAQTGNTPAPGVLRSARPIAVAQLMPFAVIHSASPDPDVRAEAAALIAAIGGPPAGARLEEMLEDPGPLVRAAACRGLGALECWESAHAVSALLDDPEWTARHAAAHALRQMGSVGELFLRKTNRSGLGASARSARNALALPPARPTDSIGGVAR